MGIDIDHHIAVPYVRTNSDLALLALAWVTPSRSPRSS